MRKNLDLYAEGQTWRGLRFTVEGERRQPPLRPQTIGSRRFNIMQNESMVLSATIQDGWYGADIEWGTAPTSTLDPVTATEARSIDNVNTAEWIQRWAHRFVDGLGASTNGPLFASEWLLRPLQLTSQPTRPLRGTDPVITDGLVERATAEVDWGIGKQLVLPLRPLSDPDASRVKAWRKLVRGGLLPPVLTWYVTALSSSLILDGHDRLVAAQAEGRSPVFLDLAERNPDGYGATEMAMSRLEKVASHTDEANAMQVLAVAVARAATVDDERVRTSAWMAPKLES